MFAEVAEPLPDELGGRRGDEDLPTVADPGDPRRSMNVTPDVALLGNQRRPRVQANTNADRAGGERLVSADAAASAPGAVRKAKKKASPCVSTSTPASAAHASRMIRRCLKSASA